MSESVGAIQTSMGVGSVGAIAVEPTTLDAILGTINGIPITGNEVIDLIGAIVGLIVAVNIMATWGPAIVNKISRLAGSFRNLFRGGKD